MGDNVTKTNCLATIAAVLLVVGCDQVHYQRIVGHTNSESSESGQLEASLLEIMDEADCFCNPKVDEGFESPVLPEHDWSYRLCSGRTVGMVELYLAEDITYVDIHSLTGGFHDPPEDAEQVTQQIFTGWTEILGPSRVRSLGLEELDRTMIVPVDRQ